MTMVICDRCGAEIGPGVPYKTEFHQPSDSGGCWFQKHFDLCDRCREALVIWIRGDLEPKWTSSTSTRRTGDDQV